MWSLAPGCSRSNDGTTRRRKFWHSPPSLPAALFVKIGSPSKDTVRPPREAIAPAQKGKKRLSRRPRCHAVHLQDDNKSPNQSWGILSCRLASSSNELSRPPRTHSCDQQRVTSFDALRQIFCTPHRWCLSWLIVELARRTLKSTVPRGDKVVRHKRSTCDQYDQRGWSIDSCACMCDPTPSDHVGNNITSVAQMQPIFDNLFWFDI